MDAYIYKADIYCRDCAADIMTQLTINYKDPSDDSGTWPQGPYPNGGGESDTPSHCGTCNVFLQNPLTEYGEDFIKHTFEFYGKGDNETANEWIEYYSYLFE